MAFVAVAIGGLWSRHVATGVAVGIGVFALAAAIRDWLAGRIPNRLLAGGTTVLLIGAAMVVVGDERSVSVVISTGASGVVFSGAWLFALLWALRPGAIGGGDVKLLGLLGFAVGLVAPIAAGLVVPVAALVAVAEAVALRTRRVVLGPGLAVGYVVAVGAAMIWNRPFGGWY